MSLKDTYIQYGVPSNWAQEYEKAKISVATFKQTSKNNLIHRYDISQTQINYVKKCLIRKPIDEDIVQKLLENNNFMCCLCKGLKSDSYIIHHIIEYFKTQDNSYDNLAVLCLNDHDLAHRSGTALTNKVSEKQIIEAKTSWEKQVIEENKNRALNSSTRKIINNWKQENPFKELQSYTELDKEYFFGRKDEFTDLLAMINKYNIVGLFGESGTGKTSLINAALIPQLKLEGFIIISVRCLDEPIRRIREELFKTFKENKVLTQTIEELAAMDTFPHLINLLKSIDYGRNKRIIIVIDQFEEIFTRAREEEREQLSQAIIESLIVNPVKNKINFLLSLREDYLGDLWEWSHLYNLEEAWIHQYRIIRLTEKKAYEVIVEPLLLLGINVENEFIHLLISELKIIGDGLIYPPYLQIVCSKLLEEYKNQNTASKPTIKFGHNLYKTSERAESIIADYLSESMLEGLTESEQVNAKNILDLLTGPEGLRAFLNIHEVSRFVLLEECKAQHIIEHLIKKKIIHPVVEGDKVIGYELVHDFLSKKFFEKLGPEAQKAKTTLEIFRVAFKEWKQHGVLASKDRLEILFPNVNQLDLNEDEWVFLIKSSFSIYWSWDNKWLKIIGQRKLIDICKKLIFHKEEQIIEQSLYALGRTRKKELTPLLIEIINSPTSTNLIKETAIEQFIYIMDKRVMGILKLIINNEKYYKLRKAAVRSFSYNLRELAKSDKTIIDREINILFKALNDSMAPVRKEVADVFEYRLRNKITVAPLLARLEKEISIPVKKAIISALGIFLKDDEFKELIRPVLKKISLDNEEDYRVKEEAKLKLKNNLA